MIEKLQTVNSLSGGKTSSYIAVHYPADHELFALVCIDDHNAGGALRRDKKLMQMVNDKLQVHCSHHKEFVATAEDPKTITAMLDLEQMIGREITWLRGLGFGDVMDNKKLIPNRTKRFCTTELKIKPIFEYLYYNTPLPVEMRIGYRYDELERAEKFTDTFKFIKSCNNFGQFRNKWETIVWRTGSFPLIDDKIMHHHIKEYWKWQAIEWPDDSNCQFCFWKAEAQLNKNFKTNRATMTWAGLQEMLRENTFKDKSTLFDISDLDTDKSFSYGGGSGCQAGFCTD